MSILTSGESFTCPCVQYLGCTSTPYTPGHSAALAALLLLVLLPFLDSVDFICLSFSLQDSSPIYYSSGFCRIALYQPDRRTYC